MIFLKDVLTLPVRMNFTLEAVSGSNMTFVLSMLSYTSHGGGDAKHQFWCFYLEKSLYHSYRKAEVPHLSAVIEFHHLEHHLSLPNKSHKKNQ